MSLSNLSNHRSFTYKLEQPERPTESFITHGPFHRCLDVFLSALSMGSKGHHHSSLNRRVSIQLREDREKVTGAKWSKNVMCTNGRCRGRFHRPDLQVLDVGPGTKILQSPTYQQKDEIGQGLSDTVDGRNPAKRNQLIWYIPALFAGFHTC